MFPSGAEEPASGSDGASRSTLFTSPVAVLNLSALPRDSKECLGQTLGSMLHLISAVFATETTDDNDNPDNDGNAITYHYPQQIGICVIVYIILPLQLFISPWVMHVIIIVIVWVGEVAKTHADAVIQRVGT